MRRPVRSAKNNSGEIARSRLKLLLVSDKTGVSPGTIGLIRDDLVCVLSRYAQIDIDSLDLRLMRPEREGRQPCLLTVTFPVRELTIKRNEECY